LERPLRGPMIRRYSSLLAVAKKDNSLLSYYDIKDKS
jgi:hypothetical protein